MQYPLTIRFKVIALASQISIKDNAGNELFYVKQKLLKLKENVEIYRDSSKSELLYTIKADKIIDWSPTYSMIDAKSGAVVGTIKRQGRRSIWKASYDIELNGQPVARVRETNPWTKVLDALLGEIPIIGILSSYMLHPKYAIMSVGSETLAYLEKRPAFFEGNYSIEAERIKELDEAGQHTIVALLMMATLLERSRG